MFRLGGLRGWRVRVRGARAFGYLRTNTDVPCTKVLVMATNIFCKHVLKCLNFIGIGVFETSIFPHIRVCPVGAHEMSDAMSYRVL